jgi:hypothetical protein
MKYLVAWFLQVALASAVFGQLCTAGEPERILSHDVYFSLNDDSPQTRAKLIAACNKYLSGHPGTIWFAAGPIAEEFQRELNDQDFDVALHIVFKDKAAHDQYQTSERHLEFIAKNKDLWGKVRVFDSYVEASSHGDVATENVRPAKAKKPAEPKK